MHKNILMARLEGWGGREGEEEGERQRQRQRQRTQSRKPYWFYYDCSSGLVKPTTSPCWDLCTLWGGFLRNKALRLPSKSIHKRLKIYIYILKNKTKQKLTFCEEYKRFFTRTSCLVWISKAANINTNDAARGCAIAGLPLPTIAHQSMQIAGSILLFPRSRCRFATVTNRYWPVRVKHLYWPAERN